VRASKFPLSTQGEGGGVKETPKILHSSENLRFRTHTIIKVNETLPGNAGGGGGGIKGAPKYGEESEEKNSKTLDEDRKGLHMTVEIMDGQGLRWFGEGKSWCERISAHIRRVLVRRGGFLSLK